MIAQKVIEYLEGSCKTLDEGFEAVGAEFLEASEETLNSIDEVIGCCTECSWWVEIGDIYDGICSDCL